MRVKQDQEKAKLETTLKNTSTWSNSMARPSTWPFLVISSTGFDSYFRYTSAWLNQTACWGAQRLVWLHKHVIGFNKPYLVQEDVSQGDVLQD